MISLYVGYAIMFLCIVYIVGNHLTSFRRVHGPRALYRVLVGRVLNDVYGVGLGVFVATYIACLGVPWYVILVPLAMVTVSVYDIYYAISIVYKTILSL